MNYRRSILLAIFLSLAIGVQAQSTSRSAQRRSATTHQATPSVADHTRVATSWSFLPTDAAGVDAFIAQHPTYDGRGVIVMIFDTGVDPGIPGLLRTTEGHVKIIDVRDFSHTGDVPYRSAVRTGDDLAVNGTVVLHGLSHMVASAFDGNYYYGALNESRFQNGLGDLNFDGIEDDVFGIVLFQDRDGHWVAYLDSDADGSVDGERALTSYHESYQTFAFHPADSTIGGGRKLNGAINIFPAQQMVSVYFDDGSHGTHVAGIATGHDIDNEKGFNGVAPGAEVVAAKFANNVEGGVTVTGSMQHAFQWAAELAQTQSKPVVVNMSFGIDNELEGDAVMDTWLDSLLRAVPNLTVCISAGNEGPGLSTVGLPGSATHVITSGAALPADAARDLYSVYTTNSNIFSFSSRGGELAKPDLVSPGTAVSTVPDYVGGDRYNGTSMSSPFSAGCAAVLLSAMRQKYPTWTVNAYMIKRAMMLSARPLSDETMLDQGGGMVDVPAAFALLERWYHSGYTPEPAIITTENYDDAPATSAAYFRGANYPASPHHQRFTIQLGLPSSTTAHQRSVGMQAFDLVSDAAWMTPVQSSIYRRGDRSMNVDVRYDATALQTPGLYTGRIWAYPKGQAHREENSCFELWNTVIVPYTFDTKDAVTIPNVTLRGNHVDREFFRIPNGASAVRITLSGTTSQTVAARMFDTRGIEFGGLMLSAGSSEQSSVITGSQIRPGVWEIDLLRPLTPDDAPAATVTLRVEPILLSVSNVQRDGTSGSQGRLRFSITNGSAQAVTLTPRANLMGYERVIDTTLEGDTFELPFSANPGESSVYFTVSMSPSDWNLFTDISCQVLRTDSVAVFNSPFNYGTKRVPISFGNTSDASATGNTSPTPYRLIISGGLALPDHPHHWHLTIREQRMVTDAMSFDGAGSILIPPFGAANATLSSEAPLHSTPAGYTPGGTIRLSTQDGNEVVVPFEY